jgi:hypothetical protein
MEPLVTTDRSLSLRKETCPQAVPSHVDEYLPVEFLSRLPFDAFWGEDPISPRAQT